jgi:hypothetical protein
MSSSNGPVATGVLAPLSCGGCPLSDGDNPKFLAGTMLCRVFGNVNDKREHA